jgi:tetratricopeptide (TPR) repeat protein
MSDDIFNQRVDDFAVGILDNTGEAFIGTGIAISDRKIVTCAHVVENILGKHPREAISTEINVYYIGARISDDKKERRARVAQCFSDEYDDDVVLLELVGELSPLAPDQIAVLGDAKFSSGHEFQSFGFASLGEDETTWADGTIMGEIGIASRRGKPKKLLAQHIQLESKQIDEGMSGAAVLDKQHNLVVGIISGKWKSPTWNKPGNRHPYTNRGVNARVLTFPPMGLELYNGERPYPRRKGPPLHVEASANPQSTAGYDLSRAPDPLSEWVGREALLKQINDDYADPGVRVVGLIGFGGEGKSSLARQWLANVLGETTSVGTQPATSPAHKPDGVFWWSFDERQSSDEFFEAALTYVSGAEVARGATSTARRAGLITSELLRRRLIFVLDGLEVMQEDTGDHYGRISHDDLRAFLEWLVCLPHESFCLITSRARVVDIINATTYREHEVSRLSAEDGRALLREIGVKGGDAELDKVVENWDGYALILSLIGTYLKERFEGNMAHIGKIPLPTANEDHYQRVHRILHRYDEHLTMPERVFLTLFSAFRTPMPAAAFTQVFRMDMGADALNAPVVTLDDAEFESLIRCLLNYRILRRNSQDSLYTMHPLIRDHYLGHLAASDWSKTQTLHERIKEYYLVIAGDTPEYPQLEDLMPLIEAVHHACCAGNYDEGYAIYDTRIEPSNERWILVWELGAHEANLMLMREFFASSDDSAEPLVSAPEAKWAILNHTGVCLMGVGRPAQAQSFFERSIKVTLAIQDWRNTSISYANLGEMYFYLGNLAAMAEVAQQSVDMAGRAQDEEGDWFALTYKAWAAHLRGDMVEAGTLFRQAEVSRREIEPDSVGLTDTWGVWYADHLRRAGNATYARTVTEANLKFCKEQSLEPGMCECHRMLGDLDADAGQHDSARNHYNEAIKLEQSTIEVLTARGRWAAQQGDLEAARCDLDEALEYARNGGYRIYEADIYIGRAWAHLRTHALSAARLDAQHALRISVEMGYHWGQVDAMEVLTELKR